MRLAAAVSIVLLVAYSALLYLMPVPAQVRTQSPWQDNRHTLEMYFRASPPPVVLVGSSMTRKLDLAADARCALNLALGGESSLTGLAALTRGTARPAWVLIETNVADREANETLVAQADSMLSRISPLFLTANKPANLAYTALYRLKRDTADPPVAEGVFQSALDLQRRVHATRLPEQALARRLEDMAERVRELERTGSRVMFFELPVHAALVDTPLATQVRTAFRTKFASHEFISPEELAGAAVFRTLDGIHLETREAAAVAGRLRGRYRAACVGR